MPTIKDKSVVQEIDDVLNWYEKRSGLLPYDWNDYFPEKWVRLKKEIRAKDARIKVLEDLVHDLTTQTYNHCVYGDDSGKHHSHENCDNCDFGRRDGCGSVVECLYQPSEKAVVNMPLELAKSLGGILEEEKDVEV